MKQLYTLLLAATITASSFAQEAEFVKPRKLSDNVNTSSSEVYPLSFENKLYFVRAFDEGNRGGQMTGHDIWKSYKTYTGDWRKAHNDFYTYNNEGSNAIIGLNESGTKLFLLNLYEDKDSSKPGISVSEFRGNIWTYPREIPVPGLEPQSRLYGVYVDPLEEVIFVSMFIDSDSTSDHEDLYFSTKDNSGSWKHLRRLNGLCSDGFDMSPFLGPDRETLYFASDREGGFGNADIYMAKKKGNDWSSWGEPENLGEVINSSSFDAYFSIYKDSTAYFASNRGGGNTDIYETELFVTLEKEIEDSGDDDNDPIIRYNFNRDNYVYFDFDQYVIKPSMRIFLDDVIKKLNANQIRTIRLEGHTDHIGSDAYNKKLGDNRAKTVKKYLVNKGVPSEKIVTVSYGEAQPRVDVNENGEDRPVARAINRRVKIEIVE